MSRNNAQPLIEFQDLAEVPSGVELCQNDKCSKPFLHAAHDIDTRGAHAKTYTCKACRATVRRGVLCTCRKETAP